MVVGMMVVVVMCRFFSVPIGSVMKVGERNLGLRSFYCLICDVSAAVMWGQKLSGAPVVVFASPFCWAIMFSLLTD